MADLIPQRFREAREYLGVTVEDVSRAAGWDVDRLITLEDGTGGCPTELELARLVNLYMRPAEWFTGEFEFEPGPEMLRKVESLTEGDRDAVLDFAEFLQCSAALKAGKDSTDGRSL